MGKPTRLINNVASPQPQAGKKSPKPFFVRPFQVMPAGTRGGFSYKFPRPAHSAPHLVVVPK